MKNNVFLGESCEESCAYEKSRVEKTRKLQNDYAVGRALYIEAVNYYLLIKCTDFCLYIEK